MTKWLKSGAIYTFSTSTDSRNRTTLLNTDVLNFRLTPNTAFTTISLLGFSVKVCAAYYRDNLLAQKLLPDMYRLSKDEFFVF